MDQNPFSTSHTFPMFFDDDMMLFDSSTAAGSEVASAWANFDMGQGRSVSSIMDPYSLEINPNATGGNISGGLTSPDLQSPLNLSAVDALALGPSPSNKAPSSILMPGLVRSGTKRGNLNDRNSGVLNSSGGGGGGNASGNTGGSGGKSDGTNTSSNGDIDSMDQTDDGGVPYQPAKRQRRDTNTDHGMSSDEGSGMDDGRRQSEGGTSKVERPRLTEEEKKNNHIASEQKRRMAIRDGFDRLTELVPGLEGQGRSESIVLKKTVDHMRQVVEDRKALLQRVQELGGEIPADLMLR